MSGPLMPKATAIWLLDNTALTFQQIADFCHLHILEIEALANADPGMVPMGLDPITNGQLTWTEIEASSADASRPLQMTVSASLPPVAKKGPRYTPLSRRQDKPAAIVWILKHYPDIADLRIMRLVGTTKGTIHALRNKTHWNFLNIKPQSPVVLGLCTQQDLDAATVSPLPVASKKAAFYPQTIGIQKKDPTAENASTSKKSSKKTTTPQT